eukprot:scaffold183712_cov48-Prasinocladus_malaysianus.AAC.1
MSFLYGNECFEAIKLGCNSLPQAADPLSARDHGHVVEGARLHERTEQPGGCRARAGEPRALQRKCKA